MAVIGFNISSIKGEVFDPKKIGGENISINSSPRVLNIKKAEIPVAGIDNTYSVEFKFETNYDPKLGTICIEGEIFMQSDNADEIIETWNEKSALHESVTLEIMNTIMRKCLVKIIQIADDLRLPPPVRLPFYQIDEKEPKKKK